MYNTLTPCLLDLYGGTDVPVDKKAGAVCPPFKKHNEEQAAALY